MPTSTSEEYPPLISLAVHEFRTPASVVGGYLRMLQRDTQSPLNDRHRKMVDEAEKSCARLVALIGELSDIGKLDGGIISLSREPLDLVPLLNDLAEHVHEAKDRDVQFGLRHSMTEARILGDRVRLRAAFDAIFRAILREKVGPLTVVADCRVEPVDGQTCAVIVVAEEDRVQDAYKRPRGLFDERRGGLGLALPLARRVIEGHGGGIWAPAPDTPRGSTDDDPLARGSAIVSIPLTE